MSRLRRTVLVLAVVLAVVPGSTPAQAALSAGAKSLTAGVTAVRVAAPANVSTAGTKCETTYDPATMVYTTTLHAKVSWGASPTRGVTGYVVTAVFSDGSKYPVAQVAAPATSITGDYDAFYATQNIRVIVTTYTSYGWTAVSSQSGVVKC